MYVYLFNEEVKAAVWILWFRDQPKISLLIEVYRIQKLAGRWNEYTKAKERILCWKEYKYKITSVMTLWVVFIIINQ